MKNEVMHKREFYSCKRLRLLQYLMECGFMPEAEMPDPKNIKYKWWLFRNSVELETAIDRYFNEVIKSSK